MGIYTILILSRYYYYIPLFITNIFPDFSEIILNYKHSSFETQRNLHNGFFETFRGKCTLWVRSALFHCLRVESNVNNRIIRIFENNRTNLHAVLREAATRMVLLDMFTGNKVSQNISPAHKTVKVGFEFPGFCVYVGVIYPIFLIFNF